MILAALLLFFRGRRALMWATLLFVSFFAVEVVDIGVTTIYGFQFFGVLFIARSSIDAIWCRTGLVKPSRANVLAALFLSICFFSLPMAVAKAGVVEVYSEGGGLWMRKMYNPVALELSRFNFTQLAYPTFGILLFHFLVMEIKSRDDIRKVVDILVMGSLVVAGMSITAGVLYTIGQGEVYSKTLGIFAVGEFGAKGPEAGSIGRFFRTYTIAGEPGFTAVTLLVGTGLVTGDFLKKGKSLVSWPMTKLSILTLAILINGSTTGYFGAGLLISWSVIAPLYLGQGSIADVIRPFVYVLVGLLVVGGIVSTIQVSGLGFYEWLNTYHIAKLQGEGAGSGATRLYVSWYTLKNVFLSSPILGVGYGSHLSLSFVTFLLANIGVLGFGAFLAFIYTVFRNSKKTAKKAKGTLEKAAFMGSFVFVPFFGTLFIGKSAVSMLFGLTWAVIALAEATYQVYRRESRDPHQGVPTT
ncbi:hypothetical protein [Salinibacter ruber]|nr:hypothetical protein [Salinibacter ruber]